MWREIDSEPEQRQKCTRGTRESRSPHR
jgi:hypothetical protein